GGYDIEDGDDGVWFVLMVDVEDESGGSGDDEGGATLWRQCC
ncbi:hypothetical protein A2U01_0057172, partial [Trifolium medium]|nr:hypothetical protein [Trifolium medium]